ncbi:hypothetical protein [Halovivax cerinus]|uniref:Uncharacterized protein n=1 Tax=Halovivax cerinus TaxID=1487865 RepID=A0ABD5NKR4_9EURY|nr:hypothetical protein [Halovivax cerinus]
MTNVYEIDATDITTDGILVPRDVGTDANGDAVDADAYTWGSRHRDQKHDWAAKLVNVDADEAVDLEAAITTSDDIDTFQEYALAGDAGTADPGNVNAVPATVALIDGITVAAAVNAHLTADPVPTTGTVKVVFNSRRYGGDR